MRDGEGVCICMTIIRSAIFSQYPDIVFGMSTRDVSAPSGLNISFNVGDDPAIVQSNRTAFLTALNINEGRIVFPQQEHTNTVAVCRQPQRIPSCDGTVTAEKDLFLAVTIADCTPVMLYDTRRKVVAGIHAGWKGTARHIVGRAISLMCESHNTDPADIIAFIGPSAGVCCYEVGSDVAATLPSECIIPKSNGKFFADIKKANLLQLIDNGVRESHIEVNSDCTIHNHLYHSHRRDGKRSGRMMAVIGIKQ